MEIIKKLQLANPTAAFCYTVRLKLNGFGSVNIRDCQDLLLGFFW